MDNHEFGHNAETDFGSAGSPIILIYSQKVIGIDKAKEMNREINYGSFIGELILYLAIFFEYEGWYLCKYFLISL